MVVRLLARVQVVMSPQLPRPTRADTLRASSLALTPSLSLRPDLTPESLVHPRASRQPSCTPEPSLVGEMSLHMTASWHPRAPALMLAGTVWKASLCSQHWRPECAGLGHRGGAPSHRGGPAGPGPSLGDPIISQPEAVERLRGGWIDQGRTKLLRLHVTQALPLTIHVAFGQTLKPPECQMAQPESADTASLRSETGLWPHKAAGGFV